MAFKIIEWLKDFGTSAEIKDVSKKQFLSENIPSSDASVGIENWLKLLFFSSAVSRIGSAVASVEYKVYQRDKSVKDSLYYALNYRPNQHETKRKFFNKLIHRLFYDQEVLIVFGNPVGGKQTYYIADSFSKQVNVFGYNEFYDIYVSTDDNSNRELYTLRGKDRITEDSAIYLRLEGDNTTLNQIATLLTQSISELSTIIEKSYRKAAGKNGIVKIDDSINTVSETYEEDITEYLRKLFQPFIQNDNSITPIFEGWSFENIGGNGSAIKDTAQSVGEYLPKLIESCRDYISYLTGVPSSIIKLEGITTETFSNFLFFTVKNITDQLTQELTTKCNSCNPVKGSYVEADLSNVRIIDIMGSSTSIDKLISSSFMNINEVRKLAGLKEIDKDFANEYFMTKNYSTTEQITKEEGENA